MVDEPEDETFPELDFTELSLVQLKLFVRVAALLRESLPNGRPWPVPGLLRKLREKPDGLPERLRKTDSNREEARVNALQLRRELKAIECSVRIVGESEGLFRWVEKQGISSLTSLGQTLSERAEKVLHTYDANRLAGGALRISISEAAATYVLPEVLADRLAIGARDGIAQLPIRFMRSDVNYMKVNGELSRAEIDAAVAWDLSLRKVDSIEPRLRGGIPIEASRANICFVFHASHPFARWLANRLDSPPTVEEFRAELTKHPLLYPGDLSTLASLAGTLVADDLVLRTEGFPSVIAHARMGVGIGLFPLWHNVLDRLRIEAQIYHAVWPAGAPEAYNREVFLTHYRLPHGPRTAKADELVQMIAAKFTDGQTSQPGHPWRIVPWNQPFGELTENFCGNWDVHYINRGQGTMPYPEWRTGKWELKLRRPPKGRSKDTSSYPFGVQGKYWMPDWRETKKLEYNLQGELTKNSLQVTSSPELAQALTNEAIISFMMVLARGSDERENRAVFGFIHIARPDVATVAPFVLCPQSMSITTQDYRGISRLVEIHTQARTRAPRKAYLD